MSTDTAFPPPSEKKDKPTFGSSSFVLGTTFKPDTSTVQADEKQRDDGGKSLFGSGFGLRLDEAAAQPAVPESKEEDMESTTPPPPEEKPKSIFAAESTTPTTTPAPQRFDFKTATPAGGSSIFGSKPAASGGFSNIFGTPKTASSEVPKKEPVSSIFGTPKIKLEEDENKENLSRIPEAPLAPEATSKAVFHLSSSSSGSEYSPEIVSKAPVKTEEPLPPTVPNEPVPPKKDEPISPGEAPGPLASPPLPQEKETKAAVKEEPESLPAVPDSAGEESVSEEGEENEEGDEGDEDEEGDQGEDLSEGASEAASEGSGVDVAKDLNQTTGLGGGRTPWFTPHSSFEGMAGSTFSTISRSEADQPRPLFGEIKQAPPLLAKPVPQSPRSPSPMRRAPRRSSALRPSEAPRSFSAPGVASQLLGRKPLPTQSSLGFATGQRATPSVDPNVQAQRKQAAKIQAEEHVLVDPEDEGIQQILQSEIEPSLRIHEFLATDSKLEVLETSDREGVPAACETLWRDINRMIDRLGLNSRSLQSFILGHTTQFAEGGRQLEDLEDSSDWVLVEAEDLGTLIDVELMNRLEKGRIQDVEGTIAAIQSLSKDLAKLRAKEEDMRKIINLHVDPDQISAAKLLPLSAEQTAQQNELRRSYASFLSLLGEAESALTVLKAKMASVAGASGKASVPTVEAVIRTINKMTSMAEKRSGDIDVLENQMRRLRLGSVGPNGGTPGCDSVGPREGSPFAGTPTPQRNRRSVIMTPDQHKRDTLSRGQGTPGTSPRKKMSMYTEEEKRAVRTKEAKRKATLQMLRTSLQRAGPNVARLRDDD
jgi:nucleoporin NUP159